ncbi:MAG: DUF1707 domain-containing protein [Nocardioidaceae bacterium]|nr:DUF1707 domain-containing protein [Nocardioidaceae bacterium]
MTDAHPFGDDPTARARAGHRRQVVDRLETAHRAGLLSGPDYELRVSHARAAMTVGELESMLRDLDAVERHAIASSAVVGGDPDPGLPAERGGAATPFPSSPEPPPYGGPVAPVAPATPSAMTRRSSGSGGAFVFVVVAALLVAGLGVGIFVTGKVKDVVSGVADPGVAAKQPGKEFALTEAGMRRFLKAYDDKFGQNDAVSATFYRDHVVVETPRPAGGSRLWSYRDGGTFFALGTQPRTMKGTVDLAQIDVGALLGNVDRAPAKAHVRDHPDVMATAARTSAGIPPTIVITVTNDAGAYGYVITNFAGKVTSVGKAD